MAAGCNVHTFIELKTKSYRKQCIFALLQTGQTDREKANSDLNSIVHTYTQQTELSTFWSEPLSCRWCLDIHTCQHRYSQRCQWSVVGRSSRVDVELAMKWRSFSPTLRVALDCHQCHVYNKFTMCRWNYLYQWACQLSLAGQSLARLIKLQRKGIHHTLWVISKSLSCVCNVLCFVRSIY